MRRIMRRWSRFVLPSVLLGTAFVTVTVSVLLSRYPWTAVTNDFDAARHVRFVSPWPLSPLQLEMHDKKKKRLPKAEMQRIFALDMRRMEYINVPIFDLFSSDKTKYFGSDLGIRSMGFGAFPWPWLETGRVLGDGSGPQRISYVPFPTPYGISLQEGILLAPGEELEFPFPVSKLRRSFRFSVLPLNTGTLRVSLGQYAWAKTFLEADVNKLQFFSVPVNDIAAMQARISATSARLFLIQARIAQSEMSGRIPVQVASESSFWTLNPAYVQAAEKEVDEPVSDDSVDESADVSQRSEAGHSDASHPDDTDTTIAPSAASPATIPSPLPAPSPASPSSPSVASAVADVSGGSKDAILDSLLVTANSQVAVPGAASVALGYNVMVVHLGKIPPGIIADKKRFSKVAPNLSEFVSNAVEMNLDGSLDTGRAFRGIVLGDSFPHFLSDSQVLVRDALERMDGVNLYRHLRDFGYQVMGVAPASLYGFSKGLSWTSESMVFAERSLDANDWDFAKRRIKIDRDAQPATGLEAVFQTKEQVLAPALVTSDYAAVGKYFEKLSGDFETFPDWRANELFLPDERDSYTATVVHQFQNWTNLNRQVRLFGHIWLGGGVANERPALRDFLKGVISSKISGIPSEIFSGNLSEMHMYDRAFGQMRDTLKVRRLAHRTLWVVVLPQEKNLRVYFEVPGLLKKQSTDVPNISLNDFRATILSSIGIPLESYANGSVVRIRGKNVELLSSVPVQTAPTTSDVGAFERLDRFVLRIDPGKSRCSPFVWRAKKRIVHISASHPVFELDPGRQEFKVYPCAVLGASVSIDWYQHMDQVRVLPGETPKETILRRIGGEFVFSKSSEGERPIFYFGDSLRRLNDPLFSFTVLPDALLDSLFVRPWSLSGSEHFSTLLKMDTAKRSIFPAAARESTQVLFARENPLQ